MSPDDTSPDNMHAKFCRLFVLQKENLILQKKKDEKRALSGSIWYTLVFTETWNQAGSVPLAEVAFLLAILYGEETQNLRTSS